MISDAEYSPLYKMSLQNFKQSHYTLMDDRLILILFENSLLFPLCNLKISNQTSIIKRALRAGQAKLQREACRTAQKASATKSLDQKNRKLQIKSEGIGKADRSLEGKRSDFGQSLAFLEKNFHFMPLGRRFFLMKAVLFVILPQKEIFLEKNLKEAIMRILLSMLLSGLTLVLPFSAFSNDHLSLPACPPPIAEEEAECYCHHMEWTGWVQGFGATFEEAAEDAKDMCKSVVRYTLTEERGVSETEADQYDYSPHITNQCRPYSCLLERQRLGLTD